MPKKISLIATGSTDDETHGMAPGGSDSTSGPVEIPQAAMAVVNEAVAAWDRILGIKLDPVEVYESMERIRKWQTRPLRKIKKC